MEMQVSITNPKEVYKAGDIFEGVIQLKNVDKDRKGITKPTKMKFVQVSFAERIALAENDFGQWSVFLDGSGDDFKGKLLGKEIELSEWKNVEFKDDQPISKPFQVKIPGGWHTNLGHSTPNRDWYVIVVIREKTGLIGTPKYCRILPVENSDRAATILD